MPKIEENTDITIPLRNLLSIIGGVAIAVVGYFHVDERIMLLEHDFKMAQENIISNARWIDEWETSGILPLDVEQNMRITFIEEKIKELNER